MKSQNQMIESIVSLTIRQKVNEVLQPGKLMNIVTQEANSLIARTFDQSLKQQQAESLTSRTNPAA